jgi:hypothetical protein
MPTPKNWLEDQAFDTEGNYAKKKKKSRKR